MKSFEIKDLSSFKNIIGLKFHYIFYQKFYDLVAIEDMFIINFGKEVIQYSIHAPCFVRILKDENILLTSSDIYFSCDHIQLTTEEINNEEKNLLDIAINNVNEQLKDCTVVDLSVSMVGDIDIKFSNDILIQILVDCRAQDYEYYRLIEYEKGRSIHNVIQYIDGKICYSRDLSLDD